MALGIVQNGSDGNDQINGTSDDDTLSGGGGNDTVDGGAGDDSISGGSGDDRIIISSQEGGGNDTADGGDGGWDLAIYDFSADVAGVNFIVTGDTGFQSEPDGTTDQLSGFESVEVWGGSGNDTIVGDSVFNYLQGNGGNDSLTGGTGSDSFAWNFYDAAPGEDRISDFTAGEDTLTFGSFNITSVVEGSDPGALVAGQLMVSTGTETTLYVLGIGGALNTIVLEGTFQVSDFRLHSNEWGTSVSVSPPATEGDDMLIGGSGNDTIDGLGGNDNISPGAGDDVVSGGAGNDWISAGGQWNNGADTIDGGDDYDVVTYNYSEYTTGIVFMATGAGGSQVDLFDGSTDTLTGVEQVFAIGGSGDDRFVGDAMSNQFEGGAGDDTMSGGADGDSFSFQANVANGRDRITDFGSGDWLWFNGVEITGPIQEGDDPSGLVVGEVMLAPPQDGITVLYVRVAEGDAGLTTIELQGTFSRSNFGINYNAPWGTSLNFNASTPGNDGVSGGSGHDYYDGGAGNDGMSGQGGNDTLIGGAGNDFIDGGDGDDSLVGGSGSDSFFTRAGNDTVEGGEILDRINYTDLNSINYSGASGPIQLDLETGVVVKTDGTDSISGINWVTGTAHDDQLTGTDDVTMFERFDGGLGNDTIDGGAGGNRVDYANNAATAGVTVVLAVGEGGVVSGTATGGMGNDVLININNIHGTRFADNITGSATIGTIEGFAGRGGNDTIDGGLGMDHARYDSAGVAVTVNLAEGWAQDGEGGIDELYNIESVRGSRFGDTLIGSDTTEEDLNGDGQIDYEYFIGMAGNDTIDGAGGRDRVDYTTSSAGVYVSLAANTAFNDGYGNVDTLANIEGIRGSEFDDRLVGDANGNRLEGRGGQDVLEGGGGDDYIDGGGQPSPAGSFFDVADYGNATTGVNVDLQAGTASGEGNDTLVGIEGAFGSAHADTIIGALATGNIIRGGGGDDLLTGGNELDIVDYRGAGGAVVVDLAAGTATGAAGTDTLSGFEMVIGDVGNDTLRGGSADEIFRGMGGDDSIDGGDGVDRVDYRRATGSVEVDLVAGTSSGDGNDILAGIEDVRGSGFGDVLKGDAGANVLEGLEGGDDLEGGAGADQLDGGDGDDAAVYANAGAGVVVDLAAGTAEDGEGGLDTLTSIESVMGSHHGDVIAGNEGNNEFLGLGGDDLISGGDGRDAVYFEGAATGVQVDLDAGTASDGLGGNDSLDSIEDAHGTALGDQLAGSGAANLLEGLGGNDLLQGFGGADTLQGGDGNDTLGGGTGPDLLDGGAGVDTVTFGLASAGIQVNLATGSASGGDTLVGIENISGSAFDDVLTGDGGDNVINGQAGADAMAGGGGNDTYLVDDAGDTAGEAAAAGTDAVRSLVNFSLGANLENLALLGTAAINATGNAMANTLTGNSGANVLNGGAGADAMEGGGGNDTYLVDNAGDVVTERVGAGADLVKSSISYTLGANQENLTLTGTAANATGNTLANVLAGNTRANVLNGGAGADAMSGGAGNDTYVVDNVGDRVTEGVNAGLDSVSASVTYTLALNVEKLTLTGTAAINGTGNATANTLTGNNAANVLDGKGGADTMAGGLGNDRYIVDHIGDRITETGTGGVDTVTASVGYALANFVENLTLAGTAAINGTGNTLGNTLTGNAGANLLDGLAGADVLNGGGGNDRLIGGEGRDQVSGGAGADRFVFGNALHSTATAFDSIRDFVRGTDKIDLSALDAKAGVAGQQDFSFIGSAAFSANATGQLRFVASGGKVMLLGSTDADATAEFAVEIVGLSTLTSSDFVF